MHVKSTQIPEVKIIEPKVFGDQRGYFFESFNQKEFSEHVARVDFVQDNESKSTRGVLRGMHYQIPPFAQAKLVRVIYGEVLDISVDIRKNSPTFGESVSVILSGENKRQSYIPHGFAHGFLVQSEIAVFTYKVDNYYSPEHERGIFYNDPELNLNWDINENEIQLSEKDKQLPLLKNGYWFDEDTE